MDQASKSWSSTRRKGVQALIAKWSDRAGFALIVDDSGSITFQTGNGTTDSVVTGEVMDFKQDPSQWGAIHFHDDDIYDACWETDFTLTVPETMESGLRAARLQTGDAKEYISFTVGAAVFSVGSIAWAGSLAAGGCDNNVSPITENVLRRFLDPAPFTG